LKSMFERVRFGEHELLRVMDLVLKGIVSFG